MANKITEIKAILEAKTKNQESSNKTQSLLDKNKLIDDIHKRIANLHEMIHNDKYRFDERIEMSGAIKMLEMIHDAINNGWYEPN